ncbi:MAG TPA: holo-ACP synthase [Candidatus Deferrimicrobiaceae bacterium]|jgi:holo-[acyl-carrier protein] synthase
MIVGTGIDIVEISRIEQLLGRYPERFVSRVFTDAEAQYAFSGVLASERLAGRFAVKEAVMKAFGTGKSQGILWRDVETIRTPSGKPEVRLHGQALKWLEKIGADTIHVSITHDGGRAVAFVIIERKGILS